MLIEKFEEQVKKTPGSIAVKSRDKTYTYMELNGYTNNIAHVISTAAAGEQVGLLFDHGVPMIAAILAVLKAGKTYVPLSADYPYQRLAYMLSDSEASLIVTATANKALAQKLARERNIPVIDIEMCKSDPVFPAANPSRSIPGEKTAYIMYTSGSTGRPKGVIQNHQNVWYYTRNWVRAFSIAEDDKVILLASFCHDISVQDIFAALLTGAALLPYDVKKQEKTGELKEFLQEEKITIWHSVPTLFRYFIDTLTGTERFGSLRCIQLGGERVLAHDVDKARKHFPKTRLAVIYGQTESSVNSIFFVREEESYKKPLLGTPLEGTSLYVVDEEGSPVKPLRSGEILASGHHISPGYWKMPEAAAEVFDRDQDLGRLYWTGDMGRLLVDGGIEFLGRRDNQVKIRGYRIEPGEIETRLLRHENIKEAVVMPKTGDNGEMFLAAYFVGTGAGESEKTPGTTELCEYLARELPDYMIPSYFVELERIPLTTSGKVDRQALPQPRFRLDHEYAAPTGEIEENLVDIWSQVLQVEKSTLSVKENFFELGGHSLSAMIIISKIHKTFNISVPLMQIFKTPTIPGLAGYIKMGIKDQKKYYPIPDVEKKEYHVLSPAQKRLYILQIMDPGGTSYNMPEIHILEEELQRRKLEDTFNLLIEKHESLRTSFIFVEENPVQKIHDMVEFEIEYDRSLVNGHWSLVNCQGRGEVPSPIKVEKIIRNFIRPFDLSRAPLLRVGVTKLENGKHLLIVDMHHIISDALSHWLLVKDFMAQYTGASLSPLRIQYKDYSEWYEKIQNNENEGAAPAINTIKTQQDYWLKEFAGEIPVLNLPTDFLPPAVRDFSGRSSRFEVEVDKVGALKKLALEKEVTRFMVIMAVYNIMLGKLSGREDIIVGTTTAGRNHTDLDHIVGMFVNTLAIRNTIEPGKTFLQLLAEVKEKVLKAFENQDYPFEDLVEQVKVNRNVSRNPLFDTMFSFIAGEAGDEKTAAAMKANLKIQPYPHENSTAKFDITLYGIETTAALKFTFEYRSKLFKANTIERFIRYFKRILFTIIENPGVKLDEIRLISSEEKRQLVYDFNETAVDYPRDKPLQQLFEEQVERTPDRSAIVGPLAMKYRTYMTYKTYISYRELNNQSDRLAHTLTGKGVQPEAIVGIMTERSIEMIVGILAILKAGSAYLPIDPDYPPDRIDYMLKDSSVGVLVTTSKLQVKFKAGDKENTSQPRQLPLQLINIESEPAPAFEPSPSTLTLTSTCRVSSANPAYVIYTSGSTGKPRGVVIENEPVVNFIKGITDVINFSENDYILSLTTLSFDIFVLETILPLIKGSRVFIGGRGHQLNVEAAASVIEGEKITIFQVTPSRLQLFIYDNGVSQCLKRLKYLLVGGEAFPLELLKKTREVTTGEIYNLYGPTETTIWSTIKNVSPNESLNIGKPIANTRVSILDKSGYIQPLGVPGELCIAGAGVARGYINNPELTNSKFQIPNYKSQITNKGKPSEQPMQSYSHASMPYHSIPPHHPIYLTGDLARWLPDGNIEFLGRMDFQVKIRGFRVELQEIENYLRSHVKVKEAVVIVKQEESSEKYLCAIILGVNGNMPQVGELREFLSGKVPGYMIPSYFVEIEEIPLTPNGKVDRKALAGYVGNPLRTGTAHVAPGTGIEKVAAELWQEVLKLEKVGIHDNFFEIGGNSMKLVQLSNKLQKRLEIENPVVSLFRYPTIHSFLEFLNRGDGDGAISSERIDESITDLEETMGILMEE